MKVRHAIVGIYGIISSSLACNNNIFVIYSFRLGNSVSDEWDRINTIYRPLPYYYTSYIVKARARVHKHKHTIWYNIFYTPRDFHRSVIIMEALKDCPLTVAGYLTDCQLSGRWRTIDAPDREPTAVHCNGTLLVVIKIIMSYCYFILEDNNIIIMFIITHTPSKCAITDDDGFLLFAVGLMKMGFRLSYIRLFGFYFYFY